MFIAINAKADIQGSKKGKLTPAQNAQVNAWCLASKTGIFDFGGKCLASSSSFVASNNEATIDFHNGFVAICGRIIECEEGTQVKVVTPTTGTINGKIILRYDLTANGANEFVVTTTTAALVQQDLNENPITGVYEFELYSYTATSTNVTLVRNNTDYISDVANKLNSHTRDIARLNKLTYSLDDYDMSKGTIEQRLTNLGFKQGSVTMTVGTASSQNIRRQGNYCLFDLTATLKNIKIEQSTTINLAQLSADFYPTSEITAYAKYTYAVIGGSSGTGFVKVRITTGGVVKLSEFSTYSMDTYIVQPTGVEIKSVGYQAKPIA